MNALGDFLNFQNVSFSFINLFLKFVIIIL
eukprot:SAG22_NODE_1170_length_5261_cov_96.345796_3_plen_30_part_00